MGCCRESRDFLLPAVIAFLNDRAWPLRAALFHHMPSLIACTGKEALEAYLLPCLEQVTHEHLIKQNPIGKKEASSRFNWTNGGKLHPQLHLTKEAT